MAKKPLLLDLAHGRAGTYLGTAPSSLPHHVGIRVAWLGRWREEIIPDVPETALRHVKTASPLAPKEGCYLLFAGTGGVSPVIGDEFGLLKTELFSEIAHARSLVERASSKAQIEERERMRAEAELTERSMEKAKELAKTSASFGGYGRFGGKGKQLPPLHLDD